MAYVIKDFVLDFSDLPATSEVRSFAVLADSGAEFILEIKDNTTGYYYNFITNVFQVNQASLQEIVTGNGYIGNITFPAVTGSDDQYNISLYAVPGTKHYKYKEARFGDGSLDINNSKGSNSLMLTKVIYQYTALTLTLSGYFGDVAGSGTNDTVSVNRGKPTPSTPFSVALTAATTAAYRILKQPVANDVLAFVEPVIGSAPIAIEGENIYPTATGAFTGDDINGAITSGVNVDTDNADISVAVSIGDKITTPVTTDTVNGAVTSGINVIMDAAVAAKMAVGDQVTGNAVLDSKVVTVAGINVGSDANTFALSEAVAIIDGITLTFSSKINRSLTTVTAFPLDASAFTISQAIQFRDNAPLTFFKQSNYRWPVNNFANIINEDMIVVGNELFKADTKVSAYEDTIKVFEGTKNEKTISKVRKPAISTLGKKPTIVKGLVTVQEGSIVFDKQQLLAIAGQTIKLGGYGESEILRIYGWEVKFTDLAITLTPNTTTTTEATNSNATIAVTSKEGVINNVSRIGGIGINSLLQNPLITSGGGATGTGDLVMDAVQTLENGRILTIENTSRIATITGNIEIVKAGNADQSLRFDIVRLVSQSAP